MQYTALISKSGPFFNIIKYMENTNQESLSSYVSKLIDVCKAHKNALLAAVIIIAVVGGGWGLYTSHKEKTLQNSWAQFYNAQIMLLTQGTAEGFDAIDQLNAAYPNTDAAYYARLMQADLLFTEENYAQSVDIYKELLQAKNPHVRMIAAVSLGAAQQAVKEYAASVETLQNFIAQNPSSFALPQAYFTLALSQELSGDKTAATETYKKILEDYTKTYFGVVAKDKINQLSK